MPLPAPLLLAKALHLLHRGEVVRAEAMLRDAIAAGKADVDSGTRVAALCCLGELMAQQDRRAEAVEMLRSCVATPVPDHLDDVCASERARARRLLASLS